MTHLRLLCALASLALAAGCSLIETSARTMILEPLHYYSYADKYITKGRNNQMARAAWAVVEAKQGPEPLSVDYRRGFIAGFMDFAELGGNGEPPPVPPRRYWNFEHRDSEGYQRSQDWFAGFRHGSAVAQAEVGHRTITSALWVGAEMEGGVMDEAMSPGPHPEAGPGLLPEPHPEVFPEALPPPQHVAPPISEWSPQLRTTNIMLRR